MQEPTIKFCAKCAADTVHYAGGHCKPCHNARAKANRARENATIKKRAATKIANSEPCPRCGASDWNTSGACRPCRKKYRTENAEMLSVAVEAYKAANAQMLRDNAREYAAKHKEEKAAYQAARYAANPEIYRATRQKSYYKHLAKRREGQRKFYQEHIEFYRKRAKAQRAKDPERCKTLLAEWRKNNRHVCNSYDANRRAAKLRATPAWADQEAIKAIYAEAARQQREKGIEMAIDHIVPLISPTVCGLHCEANLEVMTKSANSEKSNRWWSDMP